MRIEQVLPPSIVAAVVMIATPPCPAQNVSGYAVMPNPFLLLLREPAVHQDLRLTLEQRGRLVELNQSFDGELLASRNMPAERGQEKVAKVIAGTQAQVAKIFSGQQQNRMRQIAYQLRGISFVLEPHAADELQLTSRQKAEIESVVAETRKEIAALRSGTYQGKEAHQKSQDAIVAARQKERRTILDALDDNQKQHLLALVGRRFDSQRLGHVSFKAPELSAGDEWFNSKPLQLADLRGKVIALHFYAYG